MKIRLEEIKKIAYSLRMRFIGSNISYDDCMIVALYNAATAVGINTSYHKIITKSKKMGWYKPGRAFRCADLDAAFAWLKIEGRRINKNTRDIFKDITKKKKTYLFFRPSDLDCPGHAMVAVKSENGVKVHNSYIFGRGWKSMSREIKSGKQHIAIEIKRST